MVVKSNNSKRALVASDAEEHVELTIGKYDASLSRLAGKAVLEFFWQYRKGGVQRPTGFPSKPEAQKQ